VKSFISEPSHLERVTLPTFEPLDADKSYLLTVIVQQVPCLSLETVAHPYLPQTHIHIRNEVRRTGRLGLGKNSVLSRSEPPVDGRSHSTRARRRSALHALPKITLAAQPPISVPCPAGSAGRAPVSLWGPASSRPRRVASLLESDVVGFPWHQASTPLLRHARSDSFCQSNSSHRLDVA
jgi:hypothetical protein